jgi:hypothetical protein
LYSYDVTNLPTFNATLASGAQTGRIPLRLDKDADFYLRAISTTGLISLRLEDTDGNQLSDSENASNRANFVRQQEYSQSGGAGYVALESGADGVYGPAGGNYVVYLYNGTANTIELQTCVINLIGVKRYAGGVCK